MRLGILDLSILTTTIIAKTISSTGGLSPEAALRMIQWSSGSLVDQDALQRSLFFTRMDLINSKKMERLSSLTLTLGIPMPT